jgi:hypothetical protein
VHVVTKADIAGLVWACAATIGHISTTLMLPIVLDRPLIVPMWSPGLERLGYYAAAGAAIAATSPQELTRILRDPERARLEIASRLDRFVGDYVTYTDGRAWERVVASIVECAHH